jgi:hypothetical protein
VSILRDKPTFNVGKERTARLVRTLCDQFL